MTLGEKQRGFARCVGKLIDHIYESGYEITLGDANAHDGHMNNSCHYVRLAIDLNLFFEGNYLTRTEDHKRFGEYWKRLDPLARWGGDFQDGNHYSFEHNGRR